ncbi:MAG: hypothetical protein Q7T03_02995 [Deltaproteobacteria bacterium]|nr:hypothetical protein [Deltaproteobacteria bacterium]
MGFGTTKIGKSASVEVAAPVDETGKTSGGKGATAPDSFRFPTPAEKQVAQHDETVRLAQISKCTSMAIRLSTIDPEAALNMLQNCKSQPDPILRLFGSGELKK